MLETLLILLVFTGVVMVVRGGITINLTYNYPEPKVQPVTEQDAQAYKEALAEQNNQVTMDTFINALNEELGVATDERS